MLDNNNKNIGGKVRIKRNFMLDQRVKKQQTYLQQLMAKVLRSSVIGLIMIMLEIS